MNDQDRDAILARRALFISAALAGLGCTSHELPVEPDPQVQQADTTPDASPGPSGDEAQNHAGSRPTWAQAMAAAPPLDVPDGLSKQESERLQNFASNMQAQYAELEQVWSLPACAPSQSDCEAWATAIQTIITIQDDYGPLCGYGPETTDTLIERRSVHQRYLQQLGELLLVDLDAAARAHADAADESAWAAQRARLDQPRPMPCLSCMAPDNMPVLAVLRFDAAQSALSSDHEAELAQVVRIQQSNRKSRLIVRGHADPGEADADALGRRRAEAVAAALIRLGLPKGGIEVRSYGAKLPIYGDGPEATLNRRVDFEVESR